MIFLDTRAHEHPVPLKMALEAFKKLSGSEVIHMVHRREPIPLFEILAKNGGRYRSQQDSEGTWHIHITKDPTLDLEAYRV